MNESGAHVNHNNEGEEDADHSNESGADPNHNNENEEEVSEQ
jgi:hypothetical protein